MRKRINQKISTSTSLSKEDIIQLFAGCEDVVTKQIELTTAGKGTTTVLLIYCSGLSDTERIDTEIVPELEELMAEYSNTAKLKKNLHTIWSNRTLQQCDETTTIIKNVFDGQLVICLDDSSYSIDIANHPKRTPEEPNNEISIRGARDGFIEDITTNAGLIRKRLRSPSLKYEMFEIGKRTSTKVGLFFIEDIAKKEVITEIREKLTAINIDGLYSANQLEELLTNKKFVLFPLFHYSGRPDYIVDSLLRGRFVVLVDGAPTALIAPCTLTMLLKPAEDSENFFLYASLERFLRLIGLLIALFLPGFWTAIISFHQNQIPFVLLASLAQVRQGVPLPANFEAFIMLLLFELFREAGARLPAGIGQTLSVVGGIIIGDAAIRSGLTSPAVVVVVATSAVATFSLVNISLAGTVSILRFYILLFSILLGIYGFFLSSFSIILYLANLRTFGIPYLSPVSPINLQDLPKTFLRNIYSQSFRRSSILTSNDRDKQGKR